MSRAYVNYDRDDMQDDTYKIMSQLMINAIMAYREKNAELLHSEVDSLYLMSYARLNKEDREEFEKRLAKVSEALYDTLIEDDQRGEMLTVAIDEVRAVLKDLLVRLDEIGLLYKMRSDLDSLITHGGNT